jgi:hypothetical protein
MYGKVTLKSNINLYYCASKRSNVATRCDTPSINKPHLDTIIWEWFFKNDVLINEVKQHFEDTDSKEMILLLKENIIQSEAQLKKYETHKTNLITMRIEEEISGEESKIQLKRIRKNISETENNIINYKSQLLSYQDSEKSSDDIIDDIKSFKDKVSFIDRKTIIHKYIKEIIVDYKDNHFVIKIIWNLPQLKEYYLVVHKWCYYAIQPFANEYQIIYKKQYKKLGVPYELTDEEFFNKVHQEKQIMQLFKIKNELLSDELNVDGINYDTSPATLKKLEQMKSSPEFKQLMQKFNNN